MISRRQGILLAMALLACLLLAWHGAAAPPAAYS